MYFEFILIFLIFCSYFFLFKKINLLNEDKNISDHKKFIESNKIPILLGGIFLLTIFIFFSNYYFFPVKLSLLLIFLLGLLSDKNMLPNPKVRLLIQIFITLYLVSFYNPL